MAHDEVRDEIEQDFVETDNLGNHALGVAFAIQALGGAVPATVFVPATAPRAKVDKLRTFPITVVEGGANLCFLR